VWGRSQFSACGSTGRRLADECSQTQRILYFLGRLASRIWILAKCRTTTVRPHDQCISDALIFNKILLQRFPDTQYQRAAQTTVAEQGDTDVTWRNRCPSAVECWGASASVCRGLKSDNWFGLGLGLAACCCQASLTAHYHAEHSRCARRSAGDFADETAGPGWQRLLWKLVNKMSRLHTVAAECYPAVDAMAKAGPSHGPGARILSRLDLLA
jgi:hypothetical protein